MDRSCAAAFVIATALMILAAPAIAGPCGERVAAFRQSLPPDKMSNRKVIGSAPQTIGAQLGHQPTPESIARAEQNARSDLAMVLEQAQSLDAAGRERECEAEFARAKLLANP